MATQETYECPQCGDMNFNGKECEECGLLDT